MINFPMSVMQFATTEENKQVYKMFYDYWKHFCSAKRGKTNMSFDNTISFDEKESKMNAALKREILRVAGVANFEQFSLEQWSTNPSVVWATYAIVSAMIDMILPETIIDSIGAYTDVKTIGIGDSASFEIKPRDLFVVSKAGRGQRTAQLQRHFDGMVTIVPEMREISVMVSLYRVLAGRDSLADFAAKAVQSLETAVAIDAYSTFATAMAALPTTPSGGELKATGYSQETLVQFCQRVTAWNGGNKAVVLGTQLAMQNVLPDNNNYRYALDSEYVKMGYIKNFFGYDGIVLPQVVDLATEFKLKLDDTKLWIVSPSANKLVKMVLEGSTLANTTQPYQNANLTQSTTIWKSWGVGVATNAVAATIAI